MTPARRRDPIRLSDLLKAEVLDTEGQGVGHVHDARFVRDGPVQGAFGSAYRLQGLIVGSGSFGNRLGFDRTGVKGPLPLKALFRWFHGNARFVEWAHVESIEQGRVRLSVLARDLPPVPALRQ